MKGDIIVKDGQSVTILLIEDDEGHSYLIRENLLRAGIRNKVITIADGQKATDFIFCRSEYEGKKRPSPMLVLLDLNLPGRDGQLILKDMKNNKDTCHIPVVILTTTDDNHEVSSCYSLGCNIFITKPVDFENFGECIQKMGLFLDIVTIPNGTI